MFQVVPQDVAPYIERAEMPQIKPHQYGKLIVFLFTRGIVIDAGFIDPAVLKLHQEVDIQMALSIPADLLSMPIIIGNDNFVLDGDHRAYRHWVQKSKTPFIRINQAFDAAIHTLFDFINGK